MSGSEVTVRIGKITVEQDKILGRTYEAAKLLRESGFPCKVVEYICFDAEDSPASIKILPE